MDKKVMNVTFLLFTYPAGVLIGVGFWLLRLFGVLKVKGWENFPHWKERVLVVSNHPSLTEPILLIGLFFHQYLFQPFRYGPWTLADKRNYFDNWKWRLMRPRLISVDRTRPGDNKSLISAVHVLREGGVLIVFPEGGRTFKGTSFLCRNGKRIRPLKEGFAYLAAETGALVLPVWFEGGWLSGMKLTIGRPKTFAGTPRTMVVENIEQTLLALSANTN